MAFESLTDKLQNVFKNLRSKGRLTEADVKEAMKEISQNFPEGLEYKFPFDATEYISQSIHEVYKT